MAAGYHERVASRGVCYVYSAWVEKAVTNGDICISILRSSLSFPDKAAEMSIARTGDGTLKYATYDID